MSGRGLPRPHRERRGKSSTEGNRADGVSLVIG
jgi:hypothetical protein